ncbi:PfkB family carbohydrate kinase [Gramella sp. AN32]|uniref:1-phosphofructokinase family hexose kinase n=1 Tax=Christiangramia antarctica TaxID=2058158 RepID=A0ABW5X2H7_9FLAO|nr:PfkB family carbohydrate kinase [Gramella sp. AN32]MCM4157031.1 1-phosphofructokinase [Gramella sp. AN32]
MILSLCPNPSIDSYAWLEKFETGGVNRIDRIIEYPGGKGVHVAIALATLGENSQLMGTWAGGAGQWIKQKCGKLEVECSGIELAGNNRKCYTFRSERPDFDNSELLEPGPSFTTNKWIAFIKLFELHIPNAKLICMSGSWPKNAPLDAYAQLILVAKEKKVKTILDCSGAQLTEALEVGFFGLHLNEFEAEKLCGSQDIYRLLKKLEDKVELVALTHGKKGLLLAYQGQIISANVKIDKVISSVGSGDCLTAGIAYAVSNGLSVEEIAAYGVACGAANCLTEDLGMIDKEIVEKLLPQVSIKTLTNER